MVNRSAKGSRMEKKCLEELSIYLTEKGYSIKEKWQVYRSRRGGNDYLNCFDIAILYLNKQKEYHEIRVQVKSQYSNVENKRLADRFRWSDECYVAYYNPTKHIPTIELPSFKLFDIKKF